MTRSEKSIKNLLTAIICQAIGLLISFISRIVFIQALGTEYLGLSGLFTNILTVLSLAELGVGEAIVYGLYKPIAEKNEYKCKMLMQFYKKVYTVIGSIILILGISITPVLPYLIKNVPDISNINLIYILFVVNTSFSYFYSYKRNFIIADQNRYIATIYRYLFYFILNLFQIIYLLISNNYIVFLLLQVLFTVLENVAISIKADKMYSFLNDAHKIKLEENEKTEIIKNTKAMMMHKIGSVVVNSTDNILISKIVGLKDVGIYSNYYMIINALNTIFNQVFNSLKASIGNLCSDDNIEKQYDIFKKINFLSFWIYSFASVCLIVLFNDFIELWVGKNYIFSINIMLVIVTNFYITGMRKPVLTFREAKGLFYKDRYKALIEAAINFGGSVLLAIKYGTVGVFLGTFISSIVTCFWIEPLVLYKYGFKRKCISYFKDYFKKGVLVLFILTIITNICKLVKGTLLLMFIIKFFICLIVHNSILLGIYYKDENFIYFANMIKKYLINKKIFNK